MALTWRYFQLKKKIVIFNFFNIGGLLINVNGPLYSFLGAKAQTPFKGAGGVPWGQIMENEFEYLVDREGHGGHLAEKFLKKYCS